MTCHNIPDIVLLPVASSCSHLQKAQDLELQEHLSSCLQCAGSLLEEVAEAVDGLPGPDELGCLLSESVGHH